jgi:hypothetical protein
MIRVRPMRPPNTAPTIVLPLGPDDLEPLEASEASDMEAGGLVYAGGEDSSVVVGIFVRDVV